MPLGITLCDKRKMAALSGFGSLEGETENPHTSRSGEDGDFRGRCERG